MVGRIGIQQYKYCNSSMCYLKHKMRSLMNAVYDGVCHTPGDNIWASKQLITRCVMLRGFCIMRIPVIKWGSLLGVDKAYQWLQRKEFGWHNPST